MTTNFKANLFLRMTAKFAVVAAPFLTTDLQNKDDKSVEEMHVKRPSRDQRTFFKAPPAPNTSINSLKPEDLLHETKKNNSFTEHPSVLIGGILTTAALLYMVRSSMKGDGNAMRVGAQYRIVAQLVTFIACLVCAGYTAKTSLAKEK